MNNVDDVLSWIIGLGNPLTALMVGPTILTFWGPEPSAKVVRIGWVALFLTQGTFLVFGFASGYLAFKVAQPLMIPISAWNYHLTVARWARKRRDQLIKTAQC